MKFRETKFLSNSTLPQPYRFYTVLFSNILYFASLSKIQCCKFGPLGSLKWQKDNNISTLYTDLYTRINIFCNVDMEASDIIPFFVIFFLTSQPFLILIYDPAVCQLIVREMRDSNPGPAIPNIQIKFCSLFILELGIRKLFICKLTKLKCALKFIFYNNLMFA